MSRNTYIRENCRRYKRQINMEIEKERYTKAEDMI